MEIQNNLEAIDRDTDSGMDNGFYYSFGLSTNVLDRLTVGAEAVFGNGVNLKYDGKTYGNFYSTYAVNDNVDISAALIGIMYRVNTAVGVGYKF
jgi:hypothetical protein